MLPLTVRLVHYLSIYMNALKEILGWLAVLVVFTAIVMIVMTGGGALSPDYWALVFSK